MWILENSAITDYGHYTTTGPTPLMLKLSDCTLSAFTHYGFVCHGQRYGVLVKGSIEGIQDILVRFASNCQWSFYFDNSYCDCRRQFEQAKEKIDREGQWLIVFARDQHGKWVGIEDHWKIYTEWLKNDWELVVESYEKLWFKEDYRDYNDFVIILKHFGLSSIRLLSNNPRRISFLEKAWITIHRESIEEPIRQELKQEYRSKKRKLSHLLDVSDEDLS